MVEKNHLWEMCFVHISSASHIIFLKFQIHYKLNIIYLTLNFRAAQDFFIGAFLLDPEFTRGGP